MALDTHQTKQDPTDLHLRSCECYIQMSAINLHLALFMTIYACCFLLLPSVFTASFFSICTYLHIGHFCLSCTILIIL